jgi:hypothetical protein
MIRGWLLQESKSEYRASTKKNPSAKLNGIILTVGRWESKRSENAHPLTFFSEHDMSPDRRALMRRISTDVCYLKAGCDKDFT